jgi:predicted 3-demethylubiquinone-9 3-methyltransferase (glyoxalase superfamily)
MPQITSFLWYDSQAEQAANYYVSIFSKRDSKKGNSKIDNIARYDAGAAKATNRPEGSVMVVDFTLDGQPFAALNGGPVFKFNESVSFVINCKDQEEVDYYWNNLTSDGGNESMCGWLKDKYGLSWQVVPVVLNKYITDKNPKKAQAVMHEMMKMKKIIVEDIEKAYRSV